MKITKKIILLLTLLFSLQSCVFVAGATAGAAAIAVVYDHRTISNIITDNKTANRIAAQIQPFKNDDESHIEVNVFNGVVLLTGQTTDPSLRNKAEKIARSVPNTTRVYNQILIEGPTSALTRTSDTWITTKIKGKMLITENLKSSSIKVVTENGRVYLMGIVSKLQSEIAVDIARNVSGVQSVVKVFQYK